MKPFLVGFLVGVLICYTWDGWSMAYVIAEAQYYLSKLANQQMPAI